ncbi:hypothetical protein ACFYY5_01330 [Nocardia elegans]|uniref:Uncharacterized protein n=1 Tax=Nocardia elegans TaxID=300029 RepID=A0ABW6T5P5_9NOCA
MNISEPNYVERAWIVPSNATTITDDDTIVFTWFPESDPVVDRIEGY